MIQSETLQESFSKVFCCEWRVHSRNVFQKINSSRIIERIIPKSISYRVTLIPRCLFAKNLLVSSPPIESNKSEEQLQISDEISHVSKRMVICI